MAETYGILAEFDTPAATLEAAKRARNAGFTRWDVHTPYAIHGMDEAMGMGNSQVGWFTFAGGLTGYTTGMLMIYFMSEF